MTTSIGSGLGSSLGLAKETTWGTWVTPTRWTEFETESVEWKPKRIIGKGLYNGGLVQRSQQRQQVSVTVVGDIKSPNNNKGMGLYHGAIMGSLGVAPVQQAATAAYLQTHALANNYNQSLALQKGVPDLTGLITPYSYFGCKVVKAVYECGLDSYLMGTFSVDGKDYSTGNAYGAPTYLSANPIFAFHQAVFRIGAFGSEVLVEGVRKWTLSIDRPHRVDNFYMDGTGRKSQQIQNNWTVVSVDIESDYISDAAFVAQFNADTAQSMIVDFIGPNIATGATKTITAVSAAAGGAVVTATAHGFTNGQVVTISGVTGTGMPANLNGTWVVDTVAANTFRIGLNTVGFTYTSGGTAQLVYPYQMSFAVPQLNWEAEPPKVGGPDVVQPKLKLVGLYDDTHTPVTLTAQETSTTL